ncbi:MAG TPA: septal ring lytic transglycosylase RlpA family protein [Candidatus Kapabacteria bacterium]|jgi:rare lipoprotein A
MLPTIENRVAKFSASELKHSASELSSQVTETAAKTAKILLSAEEKLERRVRRFVRFTIAAMFFAVSTLIALGANVTTAFAKKMNDEKGKNHPGLRFKRVRERVHGSKRHHPIHRFAKVMKGASQMRGIASWYGNEFHGRTTASGARFDMHAMVAAHRTLPFGTRVLVTNLANHKFCIVKITDRGPYARGRIIDLSLAAAQELGMTNSGVADVQLHVLGGEEPASFEDLAVEHNADPLSVDR